MTFVQGSNTFCKAGADADADDINWSMRTNLLCDETITADGAAVIEKVTVDAGICEYTVDLKHDAGCPTVSIDLEAAEQWLNENQWVIGLIYLVAGPIIALFGLKWFPYVTASIAAIFVIGIVTSFSLAMGWMYTTTGVVIVLVVALIGGIVTGVLIRRNVWFMIGLLGIAAGFFIGSLLFAMIAGISDWSAVWGFWVISIATAALGCLLACKLGKPIVLLSTSLIGSYMFMRAWTLFFPGHYPSEQELISDYATLEYDWQFWVLISTFFVCFIGTACYQKQQGDEHEDLDDDNFSKSD